MMNFVTILSIQLNSNPFFRSFSRKVTAEIHLLFIDGVNSPFDRNYMNGGS